MSENINTQLSNCDIMEKRNKLGGSDVESDDGSFGSDNYDMISFDDLHETGPEDLSDADTDTDTDTDNEEHNETSSEVDISNSAQHVDAQSEGYESSSDDEMMKQIRDELSVSGSLVSTVIDSTLGDSFSSIDFAKKSNAVVGEYNLTPIPSPTQRSLVADTKITPPPTIDITTDAASDITSITSGMTDAEYIHKLENDMETAEAEDMGTDTDVDAVSISEISEEIDNVNAINNPEVMSISSCNTDDIDNIPDITQDYSPSQIDYNYTIMAASTTADNADNIESIPPMLPLKRSPRLIADGRTGTDRVFEEFDRTFGGTFDEHYEEKMDDTQSVVSANTEEPLMIDIRRSSDPFPCMINLQNVDNIKFVTDNFVPFEMPRINIPEFGMSMCPYSSTTLYITKCGRYIVGYCKDGRFRYCLTGAIYIYVSLLTDMHIIEIPELENLRVFRSLRHETKNFIVINHLLKLNQDMSVFDPW